MANRQAQVLEAPSLALECGLTFPVTSINVISASNRLVFGALGPLVKILLTAQADKWEDAISKDDAIKDLVSSCVKSDEHIKKVKRLFLQSPPPFVDQEMGISVDAYISFIEELTKKVVACDKSATAVVNESDSSTTPVDSHKQVAACFKKLETGIANIVKYSAVKVSAGGHTTTYKSAITKQLKIFFATLFYCFKDSDAFEGPEPTIDFKKWPIALQKQAPEFKEIQASTYFGSPVSAKSIIEILEKRNTQREKDRAEALQLLQVQLASLRDKESASITDTAKKAAYLEAWPIAVEFILQYFKFCLKKANCSGVSTAKSLLKSAASATEFGSILDVVYAEANKMPTAIDVSDVTKPDVDVPVKDVEPSYKCQLLEPPTFPVKFKFNPPVYETTSTNWLGFVEVKAVPYFITHQLSYKDRAAALWYVFSSKNLRNRYLRVFESYIKIVESKDDFAALYRKVGQTFWPEQTQMPHDYEKLLHDPSYISQKADENHEDFVERLKDCFQSAYPASADTDTNKLRLAEMIFKGIREGWLKNILFNEHYETIFVRGEVNKLLQVMKREKLKAFKAKSLAQEGLSLNYIDSRGSNNSRRPVRVPQKAPKGRSRIQEEVKYLTKDRNVDKNGNLIVPVKDMPKHLTQRADFNPRNYVDKSTYQSVLRMARAKTDRRSAEKAKAAQNKRKYRRRVDNKYRRTNTLIEPSRESFVNTVNTV